MSAIDLERVALTLQPWLGDELLRRLPRVITEAQRRLAVFTPGRDDLAQLAHSLEGLLYQGFEFFANLHANFLLLVKSNDSHYATMRSLKHTRKQ